MEEKKYIIAADVGGMSVKMGLFLEDALLEKWAIVTNPGETERGQKHQLLEDVALSAREHLSNREISMSDLRGVGIGIPGPVKDDGIVLRAPNLHWGVANVREELISYLGTPNVAISNDANIAAMGEVWKGGGRGYDTIVMLTLGTGIGGGVVIGGRILNGACGAAGEIGHLPLRNDPEAKCNCGKTGCLEYYTAAAGIVRTARSYLATEQERSCLRDLTDITPRDVFDGAKAGDPICLRVVESFGDAMGQACAQVAQILNPQAFVIGGGISKAGSIILDTIKAHFVPRVLPALRDTPFCLAQLGNDAGIYGGAKMVLDAF